MDEPRLEIHYSWLEIFQYNFFGPQSVWYIQNTYHFWGYFWEKHRVPNFNMIVSSIKDISKNKVHLWRPKKHIKHKTDSQFEEMDYLKTITEQKLSNETDVKQNVE